MIITNGNNIDFSKYKRFITFGCSFTKWAWPTWADLIAKENPHLEHINYGRGGQGNQFIFSALSQVLASGEITNSDLVAVMWSTFHRNDFYTVYNPQQFRSALAGDTIELPVHYKEQHNWTMDSDLICLRYNTETDQEQFINDDRGHMIRDCALIHGAIGMLETAVCDSFMLMSLGLDNQLVYDNSILCTPVDDVKALYRNKIENSMLAGDMFSLGLDNLWETTVSWTPAWHEADSNEIDDDRHPSSEKYYKYLTQHANINLSQNTLDYAQTCDKIVQSTEWARALQDRPKWPYNSSEFVNLPV